jgi:hypothetical protein
VDATGKYDNGPVCFLWVMSFQPVNTRTLIDLYSKNPVLCVLATINSRLHHFPFITIPPPNMTTDTYTSLLLHPVLAFSQGSGSPTQSTDHPCPIHWDLRVSSVNARLHGDPNRPLTFGHLASPATQPTVGALDITCGIFEKWPIEVRRPEGIAVADVLEAIRSTLRQRISHTEWEDFSESQRQKIEVVFNERWMAAEDPDATRQNGVLRIDCLLQRTIFAGLSVSLETGDTCILTLRRRQPQQ